MGYSVKERAESVGTYRWIEIQLMETLARWVPTTPEMEVKVLFGRHVWDCAQHADALGRRAFELRAQLHFTLPAAPAYRDFLRDVAGITPTGDRVGAFYDVVLPGVGDLYRSYIDQTDPLMDEPTVRILEGALRDFDRMESDRERLIRGILDDDPGSARLREWRQLHQSIAQVVLHANDRAQGHGRAA